MKNFSISTAIIAAEAKKRGIEVIPIHPGKVILLKVGDHEEYFFYQFSSLTSSVAHQICNHKDVAKSFLDMRGISIAKGNDFNSNSLSEALEFFNKMSKPVVLKPTGGAHGDYVFTGIRTKEDFIECWNKIKRKYKRILVEEMFEGGTEYRIVATREKVLAITNRVPANVIGDGVNSIKELIKAKNSDPRRAKDDSYSDHSKPLVKIKIDGMVSRMLKERGLTLDSIPKKGQRIFLRKNSNLSTGGDSIDCTDKVHPSVKKIAVEAIKSIPGLVYGGVDFLSRDITKEQTKQNYIIIEVNVSPGIFMHHFPYEGKPRDVAKEIIDIAFPETKKFVAE